MRALGRASIISALSTRCCVSALHVHDRRFARDRDGFLERADAEFDVDVDDSRARQHDAVTLDGVETGEGERDRIRAGAQVDDLEATVAVGDRLADFFDQNGTRGFDGHAGEHGAGSVFDDACD